MAYFDKFLMQALSKYYKFFFMILKEFFLKLFVDYSKNKVIPKGLVWFMLSRLHPQTIQRHGKGILKVAQT
jgi:hypothetical protein